VCEVVKLFNKSTQGTAFAIVMVMVMIMVVVVPVVVPVVVVPVLAMVVLYRGDNP